MTTTMVVLDDLDQSEGKVNSFLSVCLSAIDPVVSSIQYTPHVERLIRRSTP